MARLGDRLKSQKKPPNLVRGNARKRCGRCKFFSAPGEREGRCTLYDWPVRSSLVSDSFKAARRPEGG